MSKKSKVGTITLSGGYIPYKMSQEELYIYLRERNRGCGSHSSKKDYKRKDKHNKTNY